MLAALPKWLKHVSLSETQCNLKENPSYDSCLTHQFKQSKLPSLLKSFHVGQCSTHVCMYIIANAIIITRSSCICTTVASIKYHPRTMPICWLPCTKDIIALPGMAVSSVTDVTTQLICYNRHTSHAPCSLLNSTLCRAHSNTSSKHHCKLKAARACELWIEVACRLDHKLVRCCRGSICSNS